MTGASDLGSALSARRREQRLSLRDLGELIGVSFNTLSRVERGHLPDLPTYQKIVGWLGVPQGTFLDAQSEPASDTTATIAQHLFSDSRLSSDNAARIAELVREMYAKLAEPKLAFSVHLRSAQTFTPEAGNTLAGILADMASALSKESE